MLRASHQSKIKELENFPLPNQDIALGKKSSMQGVNQNMRYSQSEIRIPTVAQSKEKADKDSQKKIDAAEPKESHK